MLQSRIHGRGSRAHFRQCQVGRGVGAEAVLTLPPPPGGAAPRASRLVPPGPAQPAVGQDTRAPVGTAPAAVVAAVLGFCGEAPGRGCSGRAQGVALGLMETCCPTGHLAPGRRAPRSSGVGGLGAGEGAAAEPFLHHLDGPGLPAPHPHVAVGQEPRHWARAVLLPSHGVLVLAEPPGPSWASGTRCLTAAVRSRQQVRLRLLCPWPLRTLHVWVCRVDRVDLLA